jgi:hypothetical protein
VTTLTEGTWLRVIMAILIVVSSGLSTNALKPRNRWPQARTRSKYCFY